MRSAFGCLGTIILISIIISLVTWMIHHFFALLGFAIVVWGFYEWRINKQLGARSKIPAALVAFGIIFGFVSAGFSSTEPSASTIQNTSTNKISANPVNLASNTKNQSQPVNNAIATTAKLEDNKSNTNLFIPAKITKVIDGDTMDVSIDGKEDKIRLLLVDTPETHDPDKPVQQFGPEATKFATDTLEGKDVKLEKDVSDRDKYGRLLVYLWLGDKMFNEMLLEKGFARVAYVYPPNTKYVNEFRKIQEKPQQSGIGIWSIKNYVQNDGFHQEVVTAKKEELKTQTPPAVQKKTQPKVESEVIQTSNETQSQEGTVYYRRCSDARSAGVTPLHRGDPGYRPGLDRDGDGIACE
jgi:micrococcal nuclease